MENKKTAKPRKKQFQYFVFVGAEQERCIPPGKEIEYFWILAKDFKDLKRKINSFAFRLGFSNIDGFPQYMWLDNGIQTLEARLLKKGKKSKVRKIQEALAIRKQMEKEENPEEYEKETLAFVKVMHSLHVRLPIRFYNDLEKALRVVRDQRGAGSVDRDNIEAAFDYDAVD